MELIWDDRDKDIGYYSLILSLGNGFCREILVMDYTCPYQKKRTENDRFYALAHPAFKVDYCSGFSMSKVFDESHTLEEVKIWAEDYLLNMLINEYENMLKTLDTAKKRAEWAKQYKEARK